VIWDRFVRTFHWSLALGVVANYWILEGGDDSHEWLGYALGTLVVARIGWGLADTGAARFSNFIVGPRQLWNSLPRFGDTYRTHMGHSPLAGWMIALQLGLVVLIVVTGWLQELDAFWGEDWPQDLHEWSSDLLIVTAVLHVLAVILIQWRYRIPLVQSMLPGKHRPR